MENGIIELCTNWLSKTWLVLIRYQKDYFRITFYSFLMCNKILKVRNLWVLNWISNL